MFDFIGTIRQAFAKYATPLGVDSPTKHPEFWILCLKANVKEVEDALLEGDMAHMAEELVDVSSIGIDALIKLGFPVEEVCRKRLEKNAEKDLSGRGIEFYKQKAAGYKP